jgi:hypothetical protein
MRHLFLKRHEASTRPNAEARGGDAFDPVTNRNDGVGVVEIQRTDRLAFALLSNYSIISNSCRELQFPFFVNICR